MDLRDSAGRTAEELAMEMKEMTPTVAAEWKTKEKSLSVVSTANARNVGSDEGFPQLDSLEAQQSFTNCPVSDEGTPMQDSHANEHLSLLNPK